MMCLFLALTTGCASTPASLPFLYNQECPHVCWLGMNPGTTTAEEARTLLSSSHQIDQDSYIEDESGIRVEWSAKKNAPSARVGIVIDNGIVTKINFLFTTSVKIQEFINVLGEPDQISIIKIEAAEGTYFEYIIYYMAPKVLIYVSPIGKNGPSSDDAVNILYLNIDLNDSNVPKWVLEHKDLRQPWLGFGHLEEYLKNRPAPSQ